MLNTFRSDSASLLSKLKAKICFPNPIQLNREYGDIGAVFIDAHYDPTDLMEADNFKKGKLNFKGKVFLGLFSKRFFQC